MMHGHKNLKQAIKFFVLIKHGDSEIDSASVIKLEIGKYGAVPVRLSFTFT